MHAPHWWIYIPSLLILSIPWCSTVCVVVAHTSVFPGALAVDNFHADIFMSLLDATIDIEPINRRLLIPVEQKISNLNWLTKTRFQVVQCTCSVRITPPTPGIFFLFLAISDVKSAYDRYWIWKNASSGTHKRVGLNILVDWRLGGVGKGIHKATEHEHLTLHRSIEQMEFTWSRCRRRVGQCWMD